ncbi:hypothetical protein [Compostimonas suwonensis]|uniref:Uncharacterized protein n=1 Tax=Compostimonas suwonensis TaxID=1048394 RepID=A0A2M9BW83_9MICO|nr:hypothetical protein [Compostimonas suwonensis]PJJ62212.1 hypothetical protein CLV54_2009 [Compostimonas suwonensis]
MTIVQGALPALARFADEEFNPDTVTPGVIGFFSIFFIAVATVLLILDMVRRIRRTNYRAEVQERLAAEVAAQAAGAGSAAGSASGAGTSSPSGSSRDSGAPSKG